MDTTERLLLLGGSESPENQRLGARIDRNKALNAIKESGAKVRHDSGGRLIVIDVPEGAEKALVELLPDARLVPVDADVKSELRDLDETESLFLDALKIRTSESYRDAKRRRKFGETPEEQQLFTASDVREEY